MTGPPLALLRHRAFWGAVGLGALAVAVLLLLAGAFLFVSNPCLRGNLDPGGGRGWIEVASEPGAPPLVTLDGHLWLQLGETEPVPPDLLIATVTVELAIKHWALRVWEKLTGAVPDAARMPEPSRLVDRRSFQADFPMARRDSVKDRYTAYEFRIRRRDARFRAAKRDGRTYIYFLEAYAR